MTQASLPLLLGGCIALGIVSPSIAAEELRIGMIVPVTGPFAQVGKDMADGLNMYLEETNGDFAGAKVKLIVEDSQAKPDTAVTKAKKLTLQDKVHILIGGVLATEGYAIAPVSTNDKNRLYLLGCCIGRSHATRSAEASIFYPHRLVELAAASRSRTVGVRPGLQDDCDHRGGLRVWS